MELVLADNCSELPRVFGLDSCVLVGVVGDAEQRVPSFVRVSSDGLYQDRLAVDLVPLWSVNE